jgi:dTDP-glucose 4,6-dehydratase
VGEYLPLNSNFVIGNIIQNILDGASIKINANYKIFRSYMYADDLVKWLLKILDNSNTQCPTYNVGSNDKISIHQVANILAKKYSLKIDAEKLSLKKIDNYMPSISEAKKILGLKINKTSIEGIIKTINILSKKSQRSS